MGLFDFIKNMGAPSADLKRLYLTNDSRTLARLRHAIWGDWNFSFEIAQVGGMPQGTFRSHRQSENVRHVTLSKCDCGDSTEDGKPIVPCQHMYRLALETGRFEEFVKNRQVETIVREMRDPLYKAFSKIVLSGYYECAGTWNGSAKTHDELVQLGLIRDIGDEWLFTDYFINNAAAFNYYVCMDSRDTYKSERAFNPNAKKQQYVPSEYQIPLDYSLPDPFLSKHYLALANLRHAFMGYGCRIKKIKKGFSPSAEMVQGDKTIKVNLSKCSCHDTVRPCVHMYRLAIETGKMATVVNSHIKDSVDMLGDVAYVGLNDLIRSSMYNEGGRKWTGDGFLELKQANILQGNKDDFSCTQFFLDNIVSFIYYTYMDKRSGLGFDSKKL